MVIHPLFVHFPIAFLFVYAILEMLRFKSLLKFTEFFYIKSSLLIMGSLGSIFALITGDIDSENLENTPIENLVNTHAFFAQLASLIFFILALAYAINWINRTHHARKLIESKLWVFSSNISYKFLSRKYSAIFAFVGFVALLITGALGASIVYGPNSDPFVKSIYSIFF